MGKVFVKCPICSKTFKVDKKSESAVCPKCKAEIYTKNTRISWINHIATDLGSISTIDNLFHIDNKNRFKFNIFLSILSLGLVGLIVAAFAFFALGIKNNDDIMAGFVLSIIAFGLFLAIGIFLLIKSVKANK